MITKEQAIKDWLARPMQLQDKVNARVPYIKYDRVKGAYGRYSDVQTRVSKNTIGKIVAINDDDRLGKIYLVRVNSWSLPANPIGVPDGWHGPSVSFDVEHSDVWMIESWLEPNTDALGADPFQEAPRIRFFNQDIDSILGRAGYDSYSGDFSAPTKKNLVGVGKFDDGTTYGGVNFNPFVIDVDGVRQYYQRGLEWAEEQKRDLIHTIYMGGDIGKFVFRYRKFSDLEALAKSDGHGFNWDCVDGKQRFFTILEFLQNKFADEHGNYWRDLSKKAQRKFLNYDRFAFGELDENSTDAEAIAAFLHVNVKGTPVSAKHIDKVKSIKV